ncbi:MAG TPA: FHA domain-containing protein [Gammaproteobacteria bacterium]
MAVLVQINIVAGVKVHLDKSPLTIGRGEDNDLCIDDELASRAHAVIENTGTDDAGNWCVHDLDSTNGTFVKDRRISVHPLVDGDVLRIGKTFLKFYATDHADLGETRVINKTIIPGLYYITDKERR